MFDVAGDLSLGNQQVLLDRDDCDGLALDSEGNIWITGFRSPGIVRRLKPEGSPLPDVATREVRPPRSASAATGPTITSMWCHRWGR